MVKAKSKNEKDDFHQNGKANGSEGQLSYQYKVNNKINLTPAITVNFNDKGTIYKTVLKASYKFNDNVSSWLRYRYDTFNITDHAQDGPNKHTHRYDFSVIYKWERVTDSYKFTFKDTDYIAFDNKKSDYENNLKLAYAVNNRWTPYLEVGEIKVASTSSKRQARYRAGIKYKF